MVLWTHSEYSGAENKIQSVSTENLHLKVYFVKKSKFFHHLFIYMWFQTCMIFWNIYVICMYVYCM